MNDAVVGRVYPYQTIFLKLVFCIMFRLAPDCNLFWRLLKRSDHIVWYPQTIKTTIVGTVGTI